MKNPVKLFALFLMLAFCTSCAGQNKTDLPKDDLNSVTKGVITSHGPGGVVRAVIQDRKGNIWIASWEGIIRYDGKSFTNITSKVSSARFFSVLEDRKGNFWFATVGSGVYYYDGKYFQHFTTKEGLGGNIVLSIYEDKKGNIWFGAGGLSRYDGKSFRNYTHFTSIIEVKTGKLWISTKDNILIYDGYDGKNLPLSPIKTARLLRALGV
jgi:ligand-binding sensor domain-containing protein